MTDILSPAARSRHMARIGREDTAPERLLRSGLHRSGFRFRLHVKDLAGSPDIVLPKYSAVIFVHGCFWHRHAGCALASTPATRRDFWLHKFEGNIVRDRRQQAVLRAAGWRVRVVWDCELRNAARRLATLRGVRRWLLAAPPGSLRRVPSTTRRRSNAASIRE